MVPCDPRGAPMKRFAVVLALAVINCAKQGPTGPEVQPSPAAPEDPPPSVVLPPTVYFVEGRSGSIYFENIIPASSAADYDWDVLGVAVGEQLTDRWTYTPGGSLDPTALTVEAYDKTKGKLVATATTKISAAAASAGGGTAPSCIFIGDSLTAAGVYTGDLIAIAANDAMGLALYGTRGTNPNRHEGRGGWTMAAYTSDYADATGGNPFWIGGKVDFPAYLATNSIPVPHWVFILLGTNDVFRATTDATAVQEAQSAFAKLEVLIASVQAAGPEVRIGLMTPPPPTSDQDAFAAEYGSGQTRWRFKRNILLWDRELISRYAGRTSERVYVVPTHVNLDTFHNMANAVHPGPAGYGQIADTIWAFLKSN